MAYNGKPLKTDLKLSPIPQYFDPTLDDYAPIFGAYGASRTMLYDALGNPLLTSVNPGVVSLAMKGQGQTIKTFTGIVTTTVAVANPTAAPTLSQAVNAGSTLTAGNYYAVYTWQNANGETLVSPEAGPFAFTAGNNLVVTVPALPAGATLSGVYISTTTGTETKQGTTATTTFTVSAPLIAGAAKPSAVTINTVVQVLTTATVGKTLWISDRSFTNSTANKALVTLNASQLPGISPIETYYVGDAPFDEPNSGTKNSVAGGATLSVQIGCIGTVINIALNVRGLEQ